MHYYKYVLLLVITSIMVISCGKKETKYPDEPSLRLIYQNTDKINYMDSMATVILEFELRDGDGDIAKRSPDVDSSIIALVIRENDHTNTRYVLPLPTVEKDDFMKNGGLETNMTLSLPNYYFYPRVDSAHANGLDTMHLGIFVQDYSGKTSDTIIVGPIYIAP